MKKMKSVTPNNRERFHNLKFILPFVNACGDSFPAMAKSLGLTRQAATLWQKFDDIKLSNVYKYVESKGYRLDIRLSRPGDDSEDIITGSHDVKMGRNGSYTVRRLFFLRAAITRDKITMKQLAELDGVCSQTISQMFRKDDMMLGKIINYAKAFGWNVRFHYRRASGPAATTSGLHGTVKIDFVDSFEIE